MARKPIPEKTQTAIFLASRRRCCLCFWLKGEDEVKKGQIAHLDWNNENFAESNLAFLCLEHHDEYDSTPSQSKGLREAEVKKWRDELYKEMKYRFRSIKTKTAELSLVGFIAHDKPDLYKARLKLKNTGEVELREVVVSIRLANEIAGSIPAKKVRSSGGPFDFPSLSALSMPDIWAASEDRQDLFEPNGRVCTKHFHPMWVLMPDHVDDFVALLFRLSLTPQGSEIELEYRIDAKEMLPVKGALRATVPVDRAELLPDAD